VGLVTKVSKEETKGRLTSKIYAPTKFKLFLTPSQIKEALLEGSDPLINL